MIDTNELRRLAQAATPGPWKACRNHECYEGAYFEIDPEDEAEYAAKPFTRIEARTGVVAAAHDLFEFDREDAEFIAAANPAAISELLERLEAAEKERDDLKVKIAEMEKQEPAYWGPKHAIEGGSTTVLMGKFPVNPTDAPLYALPVVAPKLDEIKTALQRALELGQRETWTGARKHRSWEDQREEQQCWNKVWSLLGAQGEEK